MEQGLNKLQTERIRQRKYKRVKQDENINRVTQTKMEDMEGTMDEAKKEQNTERLDRQVKWNMVGLETV